MLVLVIFTLARSFFTVHFHKARHIFCSILEIIACMGVDKDKCLLRVINWYYLLR